jgi:hypothetical protein
MANSNLKIKVVFGNGISFHIPLSSEMRAVTFTLIRRHVAGFQP